MAVSFPRLPRWLCGGGRGGGDSKEREKELIPKMNRSLSPSKKSKVASSSSSSVKKTRRGWIGRGGGEEEKMGNVVFPEPDDPEWSIGWVEPHGPGFKTEDDVDGDGGGFVVLVPCYKKVIDGSGNQLLGVVNNLPNGFFSPAPDMKNMDQWLSSMGKL